MVSYVQIAEPYCSWCLQVRVRGWFPRQCAVELLEHGDCLPSSQPGLARRRETEDKKKKWLSDTNRDIQGVCAILIFNKYTYFWHLYTHFQPKWMKRQKLGNIWRNCLQLMKFLDILRIFCSFSYLKSYVLFKTEQKLPEGRMKISLWLKFFGQFFIGIFP